jgi:hypothetical protein
VTRSQVRDSLIDTADLPLSPIGSLPKRGDWILEADNGTTLSSSKSVNAAWRSPNPGVEPALELIERIETPPRPNRYKKRSTRVIPGHPNPARLTGTQES